MFPIPTPLTLRPDMAGDGGGTDPPLTDGGGCGGCRTFSLLIIAAMAAAGSRGAGTEGGGGVGRERMPKGFRLRFMDAETEGVVRPAITRSKEVPREGVGVWTSDFEPRLDEDGGVGGRLAAAD